MKDLNFLKEYPLAHRGFHSKEHPENSMGAYRDAINNNYGIELDLSVLKCGTVVCFHDKNLMRLTGVNKNVSDVTFDEIKDLTLLDSNETIPRFVDMLNLIKGRVPLLIEIKAHPGYKQGMFIIKDLLDNYNGEYAVFSFSPAVIYWLKKHAPYMIRGQITSFFEGKKNTPKLLKYLMKSLFFNKFTKPDFISYNKANLPNKYADKAKEDGLVVISYTATNKDDYNKIKDLYDNIVFENFKI